MLMTCIETLADYLLSEQSFTAKVQKLAQNAVLDTIACMAAGIEEESTKIVGKYIRMKKEWDAEDRALLYGTAAHVLDFDCQNHCLDGHDSVSITAVILALSKEYPLSGKRALEIYAKAVDADSWLGRGIRREYVREGWNGSSILSVFGCAAAAGLILELDHKEMCHALSLALLNAFGLTASFGYLSKDIVIGRTASTGIYCARMAKLGMDAPLDVVERPNGYGNFYSGGIDTEIVKRCVMEGTSSLITPGLSYKLYPVCFSVQTGYQVIHRLKETYCFSGDEVEKVVGILQYDMAGVRDNPIPKTAYPGKFDLRYCIAREVLGRPVDMDAFGFGIERDEEAAELCGKIDLQVDEQKKLFDETCFCGVRLSVYLKNGAVLEGQMDYPEGGNQKPMAEDDFDKKICLCCHRKLELETGDKLLEALHGFEKLESVNTINEIFDKKWKTKRI